MGSDSKEKQYEKKVKDYTNSLKSKVSSLKPENAFESAKETLEEVLPMFIWLRSEGKDLKRVEKITKNQIKVNDDETLSDEDNDKLNKAVESLKTKTAFATFDKYIFKDSLLKLSVMTNGEPKLTNGDKYISKLHKDCCWRRLYVLFKDDYNKVDLGVFNKILEVIDIILKEEDKYLKSRHLGFGLTKVKLRKMLILELKKYFIKLDKSIKELTKIRQQKDESAELETALRDSKSDDKKIPLYFKQMYNEVDDKNKFFTAFGELMQNKYEGKINLEEQTKGWKNVKGSFDIYPCFEKKQGKLLHMAIIKHIYDNRKKNFKEVAEEALAHYNDTLSDSKVVSVSAVINGKKEKAYVKGGTTTNDLLDFVKKELGCNKVDDMLLAAHLNKDVHTGIKIPIYGEIILEKDKVVKVPSGIYQWSIITSSLGKEVASGFGEMADLYVFDKNHKGQWDKIKGSEDLPKPEAEPVKKNSSSSKITPPSEEKKKDPKSSNSTKKTDDTKKNEKLEKELDELKKSKDDKEAKLIELNKGIKELKAIKENAEICLNKDASYCGKTWGRWKGKKLEDWKKYYEEGNIGSTESWYTTPQKMAKRMQEEIDIQNGRIEEYTKRADEIEKLTEEIKDIDKRVEDVNKQLKK